MKCLLIDDEPKALEILRKYVERVPFLELAEAFRDPVQALAYLAANPVELIFLDVNMPDMSGIQFLNALHTRPLVIFTTAYSDYAVRSYDYDAVDYLLKPIEFERFVRAATKALEQHLQREKRGVGRNADGPWRKTDRITTWWSRAARTIISFRSTRFFTLRRRATMPSS